MVRNLKNKLGVVTGAAEGLGFEIARRYIKRGAKSMIILDVNEKKGKKAVKILTSKYGKNKAAFYKCDVTKDLKRTYNKIIDRYKQVDILVNNAGIFNDTLPKKTIDINVTALIEWSLKFWEHMRKDKCGNGGTILNVASMYGYRIDPCAPIYQASKFAAYGFTKSLGHEENFAKSCVRVVAICPGFTTTRLTAAPKAWCYQEALVAHMKKQVWQKPKAVGKAAVEIFEKAPSGTAWEIEGSCPIKKV